MEVVSEGSTSAASDTTCKMREPYPLPMLIPNREEFAVSRHTKDSSHFCFCLQEAGGAGKASGRPRVSRQVRFSWGLAQGRGTRCHPPQCWQAIRQGGKPAGGTAATESRGVKGGISWEARLVGATQTFQLFHVTTENKSLWDRHVLVCPPSQPLGWLWLVL